MEDEFVRVYKPFYTSSVLKRDPHIGDLASLWDLLGKTYVRNKGECVLLSIPSWRPSLVARSDAELYDVGTPRWAKRVHVILQRPADQSKVETQYLGFVNLRALDLFTKSVPRKIGKYLHPKMNVGGYLVCDGYLVPPADLIQDGFKFPTTQDMGLYHSELSGWSSTVFTAPMKVWGGMCAQACAYMASHLMINHGARVLGVSDITLLPLMESFKPDTTDDFEIDGFTMSELARVLKSDYLRLHAFQERLTFGAEHMACDPGKLLDCSSVIAHYLDQGCPVILAVNIAKLIECNRASYPDELAERYDKMSQEKKGNYKENLHSIILVGYRSPDKDRNQYEFVYHDPYWRPYMSIAAESLAAAAADKHGEKNGMPFAFCAVVPVPRLARGPLVQDLVYAEDEAPISKAKYIGLLGSVEHWVERIRKYRYEDGATSWSCNGGFQLDHTGDLAKLRLTTLQDFYDTYLSLNAEHPGAVSRDWTEMIGRLPKYLWVQEFGEATQDQSDSRRVEYTVGSLWAWSAEEPFTPNTNYQMPIIQCDNQMLFVDYKGCQRSAPLHTKGALEVRRGPILEVGMITSCCPGSIRNALETLAAYRIPNVDLLAFQEKDLSAYYGASHWKSPLDVIASNNEPQAVAERIYEDIQEVERRTGHQFSFRGIATYIPEVSSLGESERVTAVLSLQKIMHIAAIIRKRTGRTSDLRFLEIVAGTRVSNPQVVKEHSAGQQPELYHVRARKASKRDKQDRFMESLYPLAETAEECGIWLSIELEPGLLPFVNSADDFRQMMDRVAGARDFPYPERVGMNVDCCHMQLCGISPRDLSSDQMRNRISHVHIGDIGPGHLSDLVTGVRHSYDHYREWFELFAAIAVELPRRSGLPEFSSCLSVELEACRSPEIAAAAYHRTRILLDRYLRERSFPSGVESV